MPQQDARSRRQWRNGSRGEGSRTLTPVEAIVSVYLGKREESDESFSRQYGLSGGLNEMQLESKGRLGSVRVIL